jgi:predicted transport protein
MADFKLFRISSIGVSELQSAPLSLERSLQTLFERNLDGLLGVRFLASEHRTTNGRIDTLGMDENFSPTIIEYKRASNENVINQGLFYLDWLMDHRREFEWLVMERYGKDEAAKVEWSAPRLICIAGDFTRYDEHAVNQISRNIELIRYRRFGDELLLLDLVTTTTASKSLGTEQTAGNTVAPGAAVFGPNKSKTVTESLADADPTLTDLFESTRSFLLALGDDVQERTLKNYFAFTRLKNFACVEIKPTARKLLVYLKVDPTTIELQPGFTRDVSEIGHYGTGDLEVTLSKAEDLERAKRLFEQSYEAS